MESGYDEDTLAWVTQSDYPSVLDLSYHFVTVAVISEPQLGLTEIDANA